MTEGGAAHGQACPRCAICHHFGMWQLGVPRLLMRWVRSMGALTYVLSLDAIDTPIFCSRTLPDTVYSVPCVYCVYIICIHVSPSLGIIGTAWITHTHTLGQHRWPSHWPELSLTTDLLPVSASSTSRGNNTPLLCSRCCLQTAQSGNTVGSCQYGHARNGMFQGRPF